MKLILSWRQESFGEGNIVKLLFLIFATQALLPAAAASISHDSGHGKHIVHLAVPAAPARGLPATQGIPPHSDQYYRPFHRRYHLKPYNASAIKQENREGYQRFYDANPRHPVVPDGADRNAAASTMLAFTLAALVSVIASVVISAEFDHHPGKQGIAVGASIAFPWSVLACWLALGALGHYDHPLRRYAADEGEERWQCHAMIWYLMIFPILSVVTFWAIVLYVCGPLVRNGSNQGASMGRMTTGLSNGKENPKDKFIFLLARIKMSSMLFYSIIFLQGVVGFLGILLLFFTGTNSDYCDPDVWWPAVAIAGVSLVMLAIVPLLCCCGYCGMRTVLADDEWKPNKDTNSVEAHTPRETQEILKPQTYEIPVPTAVPATAPPTATIHVPHVLTLPEPAMQIQAEQSKSEMLFPRVLPTVPAGSMPASPENVTTHLLNEVHPGDTRLRVQSIEGFAVGDVVLINEEHAQVAKISSFHDMDSPSIWLFQQLQSDHPAGTPILKMITGISDYRQGRGDVHMQLPLGASGIDQVDCALPAQDGQRIHVVVGESRIHPSQLSWRHPHSMPPPQEEPQLDYSEQLAKQEASGPQRAYIVAGKSNVPPAAPGDHSMPIDPERLTHYDEQGRISKGRPQVPSEHFIGGLEQHTTLQLSTKPIFSQVSDAEVVPPHAEERPGMLGERVFSQIPESGTAPTPLGNEDPYAPYEAEYPIVYTQVPRSGIHPSIIEATSSVPPAAGSGQWPQAGQHGTLHQGGPQTRTFWQQGQSGNLQREGPQPQAFGQQAGQHGTLQQGGPQPQTFWQQGQSGNLQPEGPQPQAFGQQVAN